MTGPMRWACAAGVSLLHLLLLRGCERPALRGDPVLEPPMLAVRLLPAPDPLPAAAPAPRRILSARPDPLREPRTQAITVPEIGARRATDEPGPPVPGAASATTAASPAPALDLRLPPPALRNAGPAIAPASPRARSIESRLSTDLSSGPLREDSMGDGTLRLRQGRRCVELRDANIARLDPFNQSVSPVPRQAEDCSR